MRYPWDLGTAALVAAVLAFGAGPAPFALAGRHVASESGLAAGEAHLPSRVARAPRSTLHPAVAAHSLAVWDGRRWHTWWTRDAAPDQWRRAEPQVARAVQWRAARPGIDVGTARFSGAGEAWRFTVALLRIDPTLHSLSLHVERASDGRALPWSVDALPAHASFGVNAGMFDAVGPWGWIVLDGVERQPPGFGPLSSALVVDDGGSVRIVGADSIAAVRGAGVRWAVQSYPTALEGDGDVPSALRMPGTGVDLDHRDARLAVATTRDGRVLIALTRFDALGASFGRVPFGPTLPEMAAILGALGAQRALFLDGGISGQMAVRRAGGGVQRWTALRSVPLALVGSPR